MGSIGDTTESSKASSTVVAAAFENEPIVDGPNDNDDLVNSSEVESDSEPPFPYAFRGKVVSPVAGSNLRGNTNGIRSSKQIRDAKPKEDTEKCAEEKKTKK